MDETPELLAATAYLLGVIDRLRREVDVGVPPSEIHHTVTVLILAEKSYRVAWRNAHGATR